MNDFFCIQVLSNAGETDRDFISRLDDFWDLAHYSLSRSAYAKAPQLHNTENRRVQNYLVQCAAASAIERELAKAGFDVLPLDTSMVYAEYEATYPHWQLL